MGRERGGAGWEGLRWDNLFMLSGRHARIMRPVQLKLGVPNNPCLLLEVNHQNEFTKPETGHSKEPNKRTHCDQDMYPLKDKKRSFHRVQSSDLHHFSTNSSMCICHHPVDSTLIRGNRNKASTCHDESVIPCHKPPYSQSCVTERRVEPH